MIGRDGPLPLDVEAAEPDVDMAESDDESVAEELEELEEPDEPVLDVPELEAVDEVATVAKSGCCQDPAAVVSSFANHLLTANPAVEQRDEKALCATWRLFPHMELNRPLPCETLPQMLFMFAGSLKVLFGMLVG